MARSNHVHPVFSLDKVDRIFFIFSMQFRRDSRRSLKLKTITKLEKYIAQLNAELAKKIQFYLNFYYPV